MIFFFPLLFLVSMRWQIFKRGCLVKLSIFWKKRNNQRKGAPWTRLLIARGMIILRTLFIGLKGISDTQCGFKIFKHEVTNKLFTKVKNIHGGFKKVTG